CLDVLRALKREQDGELLAALAREAGIAPDVAQSDAVDEADARAAVGRLATLAVSAALRATSPAPVADAFIQTRLSSRHAALYGAARLDSATTQLLLERALPM